MPKKAGIVFVMMGAVLIVSALLLFIYNDAEDERAGQEAENVLAEVQSAIVEREEEIPDMTQSSAATDPVETVPEETENPEMTLVEIDGYEYIGYLSIPDLELELPVMSDWDYQRLKLAPCRQFGSTKSDDLVIAAHNYKRHFGKLKTLAGGETVTFTDMDGAVSEYTVTRVETLDPKAVAAVQDSGHDLVLYTCTYGGNNRVAVFCDRTEKQWH